jgi:membrane protein
VIAHAITFAQNLLRTPREDWSPALAWFLFFWAIIKVLGNIEHSFNEIWGIKNPRLDQKVSDYLSFMLICPCSSLWPAV